MSKPLATKVSTPLSENVQIGPKVSIFCVATIIFKHCINQWVHQIFTGCHWSPLPLDIPELVDVRDLALLHLPFDDAPQITFTLSFFCKAVVVLEVCLGLLSCWNTALQPSLRREGIMLCFSMSQYMLAFMVPSMNCSSPVPAALMQPQIITSCRPIWCSVRSMVWALTGWPPHPFNLCSNAGSSHTSISQTQPLDMMLSMYTQLHWLTMARPVLSGTCHVKLLYGFGHHAAAQFQALGNLLIAYTIFM